MIKKAVLFLLAFATGLAVFAQQDSAISPGAHLRISLLTFGPGDAEIYEVFGHTAIRVIDSVEHTDLVYSYGTFEYGPGFELKFMRGKLLYYLDVIEFSGFITEYVIAKRSAEEQDLLLDEKQKEDFYAYLNWNAEPENKYYKYDFFFDNCATRIRNVFPKVMGSNFRFGTTLLPGKAPSFRDIINEYFYKDHWTRVGVNILLGSKIDRPMTNSDIMFLPDYLRDGIGGATFKGNKIATAPALLLAGSSKQTAGVNQPFILTCIVALLTIAGLSFKRLRLLGKIMSALLLSVTGILGCLIVVMWFWTDHQGCSNNYNILWCLPLNIIIAFFNPKGKGRYAVLAFSLVFVSLLLHTFKVQGLTIFELSPLFLALLFVYQAIFRTSNAKTTITNA